LDSNNKKIGFWSSMIKETSVFMNLKKENEEKIVKSNGSLFLERKILLIFVKEFNRAKEPR